MRIAFNTRLLLPGKLDGIGWFTAETLRRIVQAHPEHVFYFFFDRRYDPQFVYGTNVHPIVLCPQARHPVLWYLFFECAVRRALKKYRIDLFVSPDGYISLGSKVPTLAVIHDINFEHSNDYLKPSHQRYMTYFFPQFARYSTRIATVSEFSKKDIAATYHIDLGKIDVVYDGAHSGYRPLDEAERKQVIEQCMHGRKYFIFVSTILKRKNLATLLTAFDRFKERDKDDMMLLVVGQKVWWQDELKAAYDQMTHKEDVVFWGRAEAETLTRLVGAATALVYPSLFEGFGIPIIEAFQSDVPVVTSTTTSMPEVAGDAALLIDPLNVDEMADALYRLANDEALSSSLVEKGRVRREQFSWDITAEKLWDSMMKTLNRAGQ